MGHPVSIYIYIYIYIYIDTHTQTINKHDINHYGPVSIFWCCQKFESEAKILGTFVRNVLGISGYKVMQQTVQAVRFLEMMLKERQM